MEKQYFGTLPTGETIDCYTLKNKNATLEILTLGAKIRSFTAYGHRAVGGFDTLDNYLTDDSHQGAVIGRVANRIAHGCFEMDGAVYSLYKNDGDNTLHGGKVGFGRRVWTVESADDAHVTLSYVSPDMEEGFPGELSVTVTYTLEGTALLIDYEAHTDKKTPVALTNHAYFNLSNFEQTVLNHRVEIEADEYSDINENMIPIRRVCVEGTPFDLRSATELVDRMGHTIDGYDHNFVLSGKTREEIMGRTLTRAARAEGKYLSLTVYTDAPGVQFYTGNFLGGGAPFFTDVPVVRHSAMCFETQTEPNAVQKGEIWLLPADVYRHTTIYRLEKVR